MPLPDRFHPDEESSLTDLVNRVLDKGAVVAGDVTISVAGIDLVYVGLRLLVSGTESIRKRREADHT